MKIVAVFLGVVGAAIFILSCDGILSAMFAWECRPGMDCFSLGFIGFIGIIISSIFLGASKRSWDIIEQF